MMLQDGVYLTEVNVDFASWSRNEFHSNLYDVALSLDGKGWIVLRRDADEKDYQKNQALGHKAKCIRLINQEGGRECVFQGLS